jgi:Virulence-associated protein E
MQDHQDDNQIRHDINNTNGGRTQAESLTEELFKLFWGDALKHVKQGGFKHKREDGKHVFERPISVATPLSALHVQQHLAGSVRISSISLCQNDTCVWGGLDVDLYGATPDKSLDIIELRQRIAALSLPLYYSTSKSGGGHIYLFADAPVAASTLRKTLQSVAKALGLVVTGKKKNAEVYPKQDTTSSSAEFGNAMELPYCGMKYDGCLDTGIWVYGQGAVPIEIFLRNVKKATIADIKNFVSTSGKANGHDKDARELHVLVNKLSNDTRELLQDPHHPNRSDACSTIITEMITRGFSDEEIFLVLHSYPNGPAKHYPDHKSKPSADIRRIRLKYKRNSFEWPQGTIETKNGGPAQNVHNVALVLRSHDLNGLFVYDEMERKVKVTEALPDVFNDEEPRQKDFPYGFRDIDCIHMQTWFQTIGMSSVKQDTIGQGIYYVAMDRSYHPVKQYLGLLKWDGRRRLNTWLSRALGVTPNRYHAAIGCMFLISMVARIYRPAAKSIIC